MSGPSQRTAPSTPAALSIAGSDPTGGAGLQADLQVFRHFGVHGMAVVTALTVQDSARVHQVLPAFPSVVLDQLRAVLRDVSPQAVKVGMLASDDVVRNVSLGLAELPDDVPVVLDPILVASDGTALLERRAWGSLGGLIARAQLVTPNLPELEALAGRPVGERAEAESAARAFVEESGAGAVLVTGGHRSGPPDDLLVMAEADGLRIEWLPGERLDVGAVHGTGCALSSAIAARLASGAALDDAVETARRFVAAGLQAATARGAGARFLVHP